MCTSCGCGGDGATLHPHPQAHPYQARRRGGTKSAPTSGTVPTPNPGPNPAGVSPIPIPLDAASAARHIAIEQDILAGNDAQAARNRQRLAAAGVFALNLVSGPGSGKTTLLVSTIEGLAGELPLAVVEGDQQTSRDAERIRATGAPAVQINTGKGCHLDARMLERALDTLALENSGLLLIENVGNLVCPAAFDLGEAHKVVILSVTEGEDKPIKYPDMFRAANLMLLNKCDLLPYLSFDVAQAEAFARQVNPDIRILHVSATRGDGMDAWLDWLRDGAARHRHSAQDTATASANPATAPA